MDVLEIFASIIAEDIKTYVEHGGTLDDLDPEKVYSVENNE